MGSFSLWKGEHEGEIGKEKKCIRNRKKFMFKLFLSEAMCSSGRKMLGFYKAIFLFIEV